jgi:hypothetical protein
LQFGSDDLAGAATRQFVQDGDFAGHLDSSTTNAAGRWPYCSSSTPITAASATSGCAAGVFSTSIG